MMAKAAITKPKLSLNMKMPNGKRIGDCTFGELANEFTIGELMKVYPNIGFWFRLMDSPFSSKKQTETSRKRAPKKPISKSPTPRLNGSFAGFIDDEEDRNPSGVARSR
jgi:hypothetical protein